MALGIDCRTITMDLRGCKCAAAVSPRMLGGLLPLGDSKYARRFPTSIPSGRQQGYRWLAIKASGSRDDYEFGAGGQGMVDADMLLLRKRIYELKRQENSYESPKEWTEWEKRCQQRYHSQVFRAVECLQYNLINTRPGVGIAVLSLICVSVPASLAVVLLSCATHLTAWIADNRTTPRRLGPRILE